MCIHSKILFYIIYTYAISIVFQHARIESGKSITLFVSHIIIAAYRFELIFWVKFNCFANVLAQMIMFALMVLWNTYVIGAISIIWMNSEKSISKIAGKLHINRWDFQEQQQNNFNFYAIIHVDAIVWWNVVSLVVFKPIL